MSDSPPSSWYDPPDLHEEDGCDLCHDLHISEGVFIKLCSQCQDEKPCPKCSGTGWYEDQEIEDICSQCKGNGRLLK